MSLLSNRQALDAANYNKRKARTVGWKDNWHVCAGFLKLPPASLTAEQFAQHVAQWQDAQPDLTVDGKLGRKSWKAMQEHQTQGYPAWPLPGWLITPPPASPARAGGGRNRVAPDSTIAAGGSEAPWMDVAREQMNTRWRGAGRRIEETEQGVDEAYFQATPQWGGITHELGAQRKPQNTHWCAAFVNYCLHVAGYSHTGSAGAASFVGRGRWHFRALDAPRRGCVIVVEGPSHVAFLDRWNDLPENPRGDVRGRRRNGLILFGGNQSDTVCAKGTNRKLVAAHDSYGGHSPYLWPEQGPGTCNCDLVTARPHHCGRQWR